MLQEMDFYHLQENIHVKIVKQEPDEKIIIPPGKRHELLKLQKVLLEHYEISKLLNDS